MLHECGLIAEDKLSQPGHEKHVSFDEIKSCGQLSAPAIGRYKAERHPLIWFRFGIGCPRKDEGVRCARSRFGRTLRLAARGQPVIQAVYKGIEIEMELHQLQEGFWKCDYTLIKHPGR